MYVKFPQNPSDFAVVGFHMYSDSITHSYIMLKSSTLSASVSAFSSAPYLSDHCCLAAALPEAKPPATLFSSPPVLPHPVYQSSVELTELCCDRNSLFWRAWGNLSSCNLCKGSACVAFVSFVFPVACWVILTHFPHLYFHVLSRHVVILKHLLGAAT